MIPNLGPRLPIAIVGAGPAGLTAAYALAKRGHSPIVFEKSHDVGGISRTVCYRNYRLDIGGHRFYTKIPEVEAMWRELLGPDLLERPRLSRIFYDGRFFEYPLNLADLARNLGVWESARFALSYLQAQLLRPFPVEETFEHWVTNRFGRRLFEVFFRPYTEKIWGLPCSQIRADWAAQRIKDLSLRKAVWDAIRQNGESTSLIRKFLYPRMGPGMMWERCRDEVVRLGGTVELGTNLIGLRHRGGRVESITVETAEGRRDLEVDAVINSMPVNLLIRRLDPPPPDEVLRAAAKLRYRDFLIVGLVVDRVQVFPDNWIYVHSPEVQVCRIQNFKNWSPEMVPRPDVTCLGMEYFCNRDDPLWRMPDRELVALAGREFAAMGLGQETECIDGFVVRQEFAYPVYDEHYAEALGVLRDYLGTFSNLQTVGRAGMHRYNNQDHSMLTALLAVENLDGRRHDLWGVNTERSYHEEFKTRPVEPDILASRE